MSDRKRFLFKFQRRTGLVSSQISKVSAHEQNESVRDPFPLLLDDRYSLLGEEVWYGSQVERISW